MPSYETTDVIDALWREADLSDLPSSAQPVGKPWRDSVSGVIRSGGTGTIPYGPSVSPASNSIAAWNGIGGLVGRPVTVDGSGNMSGVGSVAFSDNFTLQGQAYSPIVSTLGGYINNANGSWYFNARLNVEGPISIGSYYYPLTLQQRSGTYVRVQASQGLRVRNQDDTADAPLTAGAITASGMITTGTPSVGGYIRLHNPVGSEANIYARSAGGLQMDTSSNGSPIQINGSHLILGASGDISLSRQSATVLQLGNGGANASGSLSLNNLNANQVNATSAVGLSRVALHSQGWSMPVGLVVPASWNGGVVFTRGLSIFDTVDAMVASPSAGVVEINNGTMGQLRDLSARNITASGSVTSPKLQVSSSGAGIWESNVGRCAVYANAGPVMQFVSDVALLASYGGIGWVASGWPSSEAASTMLRQDGAGIVAQRNGTNGQMHRVYKTHTNATNFETFEIDAATDPNSYRLGSRIGSAGGTSRLIDIGSYDSASNWTSRLRINGAIAELGSQGQVMFGSNVSRLTTDGGNGFALQTLGAGAQSGRIVGNNLLRLQSDNAIEFRNTANTANAWLQCGGIIATDVVQGTALRVANSNGQIDLSGTWIVFPNSTGVRIGGGGGDTTGVLLKHVSGGLHLRNPADTQAANLAVGAITTSGNVIVPGNSIIGSTAARVTYGGSFTYTNTLAPFITSAVAFGAFNVTAQRAISIPSESRLQWSNSTTNAEATAGVAIEGNGSTGIVEINNGTAGTLRDLSARNITASSGVAAEFITPASGTRVAIGTNTGYWLDWDNNGLYSRNYAQPLGTASHPWGTVTCGAITSSGNITSLSGASGVSRAIIIGDTQARLIIGSPPTNGVASSQIGGNFDLVLMPRTDNPGVPIVHRIRHSGGYVDALTVGSSGSTPFVSVSGNITANGDITTDASSATTSNPRLMGFTGTGGLTRHAYDRNFTGIQAGGGQGFHAYAYWGIRLDGLRQTGWPSYVGEDATQHVLIPCNTNTAKGLVVRNATGQTGNPFEVQNVSSNAVFSVTPEGNAYLNQIYLYDAPQGNYGYINIDDNSYNLYDVYGNLAELSVSNINASGTISAQGYAFRSGSANPTVSNLPSGLSTIWKNTTTGTIANWVNDGGLRYKSADFTLVP